MEDLQKFLNIAEATAREAGGLARQHFKLGMTRKWKEDNTPVTVTDQEVNALIIARLKAAFPTHAVMAEEGSDMSGDRAYTWVCDPIDGTIPFSHGIPTFVNSIALTKDGVPIVAAVYDPMLDRMFTAAKGGGAWLNGNPLHVSSLGLIRATTAAMHVCPPTCQLTLLDVFLNVKGQGVKVIDPGSGIYAAMLVAAGELTAALFHTIYSHDAASVKLIVEEAGGKVTDLAGEEQRYDGPINGFIASNGVCHDDFLNLIQASKK